MSEERAKIKAESLNKYVRHPSLSYRAVRTGEKTFGVGQFVNENQVAVVA